MLHIFGKMIFKHPDTVPQMRSKPIHFHKKAKNIFGNIVVQTDKIIFASDIFVKHFCWDFQTCLSKNMLPTRGAPGGPHHQPKSVAIISRNPSPPAIGGGGAPSTWKTGGPGPLSAGERVPQAGLGQLPGAYGGAPKGSPLSPW